MKNFPRSNLLYVLAAVVVIAGYFIFFGGKEGEIKYVTQKVERGDITSLVRASGTLKPTKEAKIYSQINGTIKRSPLRGNVNDEVKKGQVLALMEEPEGLSGDVQYFKEILRKTTTDLEISTNSHEARQEALRKRAYFPGGVQLISLRTQRGNRCTRGKPRPTWKRHRGNLTRHESLPCSMGGCLKRTS